MPLDMNDIKTIQTEAKILGIKLQKLDEEIKSLKRVMIDLKQEQVKTNTLLWRIAENTDKSILGRDLAFTSDND